MKRLWPLALLLSGCPFLDRGTEATQPKELSSFKVEVLRLYTVSGNTQTPVDVVSECARNYPSQAEVPLELRGTPECRYIIPPGEVRIDLQAQALDLKGEPVVTDRPVSFRVVPGELSADQRGRWAPLSGGVLNATVTALKLYGEVRVWVEDAPPTKVYPGGEEPDPSLLPDEDAGTRSWASGTSAIIYFADHTIQSLQDPGILDNRGSPFVGEFVVVGKNPNTGEKLTQSCHDDAQRNGADSLMVVTGLDPSGFFVTDITACRKVELTQDINGDSVRNANIEPREPCVEVQGDGTRALITDGGTGLCEIGQTVCRSQNDCPRYLPGTFGSMFIYNYNYPDGLDTGDLLFTLSGSVQEFTSTTQLTFPAWLTAERVRQLPEDQWNKWLQYAKPYDLGGRTCGQDNVLAPYLTDALCGHNRRNMKMESLESGLVRARRVSFPKRFADCDFNGDGTVPFFCENPPSNSWSLCGDTETAAETTERTCNQECTLGIGQFAGERCSERTNFEGFGQFVVEMQPAGPEALGGDPQLPQRYLTLTTTANDGGVQLPRLRELYFNANMVVTCDHDTRYRLGDSDLMISPEDPVFPAGVSTPIQLTGNDDHIALAAVAEASSCVLGVNARTRINLVTKDAVPELNPDCDENDANEVEAVRCRALRAATFDVVGHLRHVQAARPRWAILPRDADDLCCYPGAGLQCPAPIKPCN